MIVDRLDLDSAVAEGIISPDQALQLRDLAMRERSSDETAVSADMAGVADVAGAADLVRDEPFRLLRGFRDIFIAVSVVIVAVGLSAVAMRNVGAIVFGMTDASQIGNVSGSGLFIAIGIWLSGVALAEIITRRRRLPLTSLVIAVLFAVWSAYLAGLIAYLSVSAAMVQWGAMAGAILGTVFFYWRYRLPFALFLLAGLLVYLSIWMVGKATGTPWFAEYGRALIGVWGCVIFIAAMWFDLKDRLRVTRLAENALWLHLAAAPMLVHAVLFGGDGTTGLGYALGMMTLLSVAALLIDRRALLVSGLGYFAVAISQLVSSGAVSGMLNFAVTTVILGGVMLVLGLGWTPIRARLVAAVPFDGLKSRLPPALP